MAPSALNFYSDGNKFASDHYAPPDLARGPSIPAIVLCHGCTGTRRSHLPDYTARLSEAGYMVLTFDYKGWGDSEGPKYRLVPYSQVADVQAALSFITAQYDVNKAQLGLFVTSYGVSVAVWTAAIDSRVKCLVASIGRRRRRPLDAQRTTARLIRGSAGACCGRSHRTCFDRTLRAATRAVHHIGRGSSDAARKPKRYTYAPASQ